MKTFIPTKPNNYLQHYALFIISFILISFSNSYAQTNTKSLTNLSFAVIDSLTFIEYRKGNFEGCLVYMQAARDKIKAISGEQDSAYASYTSNIGFFFKQLGQYEKAEKLYLEAKSINAKVLGEKHPTFALSLNNLAALYQAMGNYEKAEPLFLQAKDIRYKTLGEGNLRFAESLSNLGNLYNDMGDYEKAEAIFLQAKTLHANILGENHLGYALLLNNLAGLYMNMKKYEQAELLYIQAKNIRTNTIGENHPDFAQSLNNLASLYKSINKHEKALPLYLQAQKIWANVLGEEHPLVATSINNLADLYFNIQDYNKAELSFIQAKNIRAKSLGKEHPDFALTLLSLANLYKEMGRLDTALHYCLQSIDANSSEVDSSFYAKETPSSYQATAIINWSNLERFNYYSNEYINNSIMTLISILKSQFELTNDKTKLEIHYKIAQSAIRLNEQIRNDFTSEGDKLRTLSTSNGFILEGIQAGILLAPKGYQEEVFSFAELDKAVLLMDAAKSEKAYQFGDLPDSLVAQEQLLQKEYAKVKAALLENLQQEERNVLQTKLVDLSHTIDVFSKNIKSKHPKYAAIKYENKTAKTADIQSVFDDKTALIEYVIGDSTIYIFYIDKKNFLLEQKFISTTFLTNKIKSLHQALSNYKLLSTDKIKAYHQYTENAYWFYENLISPVLKNIKEVQNGSANQIEKLIIVTDGELGHLPFEAFLVEPAPQKETDYKNLHYLVNDYQVSYNYSATLWKTQLRADKGNKTSQHQPNNGQLFALAANYEIKLDSTKSGWRLPAYQRLRNGLIVLPEAQKEVQTLAESFNGFFAFDKNASEKIFKEKAGDYAIIHLAMHGLLDAKNPILSSLAFTEDGDSVENNFLQAYEISKMKLNADLVVLSACETGYGRFEKGNGIASLAQAFAYAGAPAMIVTLWQVNDFATSEIIKNLYQNLANGMTKDQALQEAKIKYLKEAQGIAAHPAFWSPFILIGNTDAVVLKTKNNWWWWFLGGGILTLGSFLILRRNKKH